MPLSTEILIQLQKNLQRYEGRINHLYLDTKGKVTVGVGHLVSNKNAMSGVTMYKIQNNKLIRPATLHEKMIEYEKIKKLSFGKRYEADYFYNYSTLIMKESDITFLLSNHINRFYSELINIYNKANGFSYNFVDFEPNLQLALFDMIFNLGATKLVNSFPNFNNALKSEEFETAAKECHQLDVSEARNAYVKELILSIIVEA